jgi:hypothetical protein
VKLKRENLRLRVFENMVIRIFGPKRDEVTGGWRKLHIEGKTLGQGISPSQARYLYKHRINKNIHALSGIRTHDRSV